MALEACFLINSEFEFCFSLFSFKPGEQSFKICLSLQTSLNTFGIAQPGILQPLIPEIP